MKNTFVKRFKGVILITTDFREKRYTFFSDLDKYAGEDYVAYIKSYMENFKATLEDFNIPYKEGDIKYIEQQLMEYGFLNEIFYH